LAQPVLSSGIEGVLQGERSLKPAPAREETAMVIQALIADDEALARRKLRDILSTDPGIEIVGEAASGPETVHLARQKAPQVIFLDVSMPGSTGFDVLNELSSSEGPSRAPRVVITTAHDQYALRAFDARAVDYLLKPYTPERLRVAVERARKEIFSSGDAPVTEFIPPAEPTPHLTRLLIKSRGRILFVWVSEVLWIGAEENYVRINTGKETHLLRETISSLEQKLDPEMFLRIHRSSIVNLRFVKEVRAQSRGESVVVLANGQKIAMSRSYYSRLRSSLKAS
jgi:two-component system, LytTR family, response regulator